MPILTAFGSLSKIGAQGARKSYSANFNNASYCSFSTSSLDPGGGDFSAEFFINQTADPPFASWDVIFDLGYQADVGGLYVRISTSRQISALFGDPSGGLIGLTSLSSIALNTWYYIAVSRVSNVTRLFINSTQVATNSSITWSLSFSGNRFGAGIYFPNQTNYLNAKLSSFRLNVGSGFSTATVPTSPLLATSETKILTFQSGALINEIGGASPATNTGVTVSPATPF